MKPTQLEIPGAEAPVIPEVLDAAIAYVDLKDQLDNLRERVAGAKLHLTQLLNGHADDIGRDERGGISYRCAELFITLKPKEAVLKVETVEEAEMQIHQAPQDNSEG